RRVQSRGPIPFPYTTLFRSSWEKKESCDDVLPVGSSSEKGGFRAHANEASDGCSLRGAFPHGPVSRLGPVQRGAHAAGLGRAGRSEEDTSELQSRENLVCRL